MIHSTKEDWLLWLLDRTAIACVVETDARGVLTHFGPGAEAFFACPADEALGKLRYSDFHDAKEMEACRGSAQFQAAIRNPGWTEDLWCVIPRAGEPFSARVTLVPLWGLDSRRPTEEDKPAGWLALYRRVDSGE